MTEPRTDQAEVLTPQQLTAQQLRVVLKRRTQELRLVRAGYYQELSLLRGQLFGVKKMKDGRPAIKFQVESDLELLHESDLEVLHSMAKDTRVGPGATSAGPQLVQLKRSIMKALSTQAMKNDLLISSMREKLDKVEKEKNVMVGHIEKLEITGKLELNRQIKKLRMASLRLMAEAERKMAALRARVKSANAAKEETSRQAVSSQMHTKESVKTVFEAAMSSVQRSENQMQRKLDEMDARLQQSCHSLENTQRIMSVQALKRYQARSLREEEDRRKVLEVEQEQALEASMEVRKELEQAAAAQQRAMEKVDEKVGNVEKVDVLVQDESKVEVGEVEEMEKVEEMEVVEKVEEVEEMEMEVMDAANSNVEKEEWSQEFPEQEVFEKMPPAYSHPSRDAENSSVTAASSLQEMEDYLAEYEENVHRRETHDDDFVRRNIRQEENVLQRLSPSPPKGRRKMARHNKLSPRNRSTSMPLSLPLGMPMPTQERRSQNLPQASFLGFSEGQQMLEYNFTQSH